MKKLFTFFLTLFAASSVWAIKVNGIYYNITGDNSVEVTYTPGSDIYSGNIVIPSTITYEDKQYSVTSIGVSAFAGRDVTDVSLPNTITTIGMNAFTNCSIKKISLPEGVTIERSAFACTYNLQSIIIPQNATVQRNAFDFSEIRSITILENATINADAFRYSKNVTTLNLPENFIIFHDNSDCSTNCGGIPFLNGDFLFIITKDKTVYVEDVANKQITKATIPETITITSGQTYPVVGIGSFNDCENLTSIVLPATIKWIVEFAFSRNKNLSKVTCYATTPPVLYYDAFDNYDAELYIPCKSKELYEYSARWASFRHIMCGTTAVSEVSANEEITVIDNQIFVNGEAPAFVVTVSGQKIANANLKAGVYFVVVDGKSVSVSVR